MSEQSGDPNKMLLAAVLQGMDENLIKMIMEDPELKELGKKQMEDPEFKAIVNDDEKLEAEQERMMYEVDEGRKQLEEFRKMKISEKEARGETVGDEENVGEKKGDDLKPKNKAMKKKTSSKKKGKK